MWLEGAEICSTAGGLRTPRVLNRRDVRLVWRRKAAVSGEQSVWFPKWFTFGFDCCFRSSDGPPFFFFWKPQEAVGEARASKVERPPSVRRGIVALRLVTGELLSSIVLFCYFKEIFCHQQPPRVRLSNRLINRENRFQQCISVNCKSVIGLMVEHKSQRNIVNVCFALSLYGSVNDRQRRLHWGFRRPKSAKQITI